MKNKNYYVLFFSIFLSFLVHGQTHGEKNTVSIKITNYTNSSVTFEWDNFSISTTDIYRKEISGNTWNLIKNNSRNQSYTDNNIDTAVEYEYMFEVTTGSSPALAYGYIAFGVKIPKKTSRGTLLTLVDDRFETSLSKQLEQLQMDLISDGWNPIMLFCSKDSSVTCVKSMVDSIHNMGSLNAVYLIGHIPVPYAGLLYPDGHTDHQGAWPTDLYYVSDPANWSDNTITYTNTSRPINSNHYTDGKFDNSQIQDELYCAISRIDFYNMSMNPGTETNTLRNYLDEASKYKRGITTSVEKGLVDDNLSNLYEGFSYNGHMNFSSLYGDSVELGNFINDLETQTYKWSYACGYGSDTSLSGIGTSRELYNSDYKGVFSMVFGSYFGDWNTQDNFMRSLLVDGKMLTTCWGGRPNWFYHHMGLNNPIALSAQKSISNSIINSSLNSTPYANPGNYMNGIHMQLLGDLSLRHEYDPAITAFDATYNSSTATVTLEWEMPNSDVNAFNIYKSNSATSGYSLLATVASTDSTYVDSSPDSLGFYYIQYTSLQTTASGSYYNNSLGTFISIDTSSNQTTDLSLPVELIDISAKRVDNYGEVKWTSASEYNFSHYEVEFSDDAITWEFMANVIAKGSKNTIQSYKFDDLSLGMNIRYYRLKMVDYDGSYEYSGVRVVGEKQNKDFVIYPNPSTTSVFSISATHNIETENIIVYNGQMQEIPHQFDAISGKLKIDPGVRGMVLIKIGTKVKRVVRL